MMFYSCALSDFEHENTVNINLTNDKFTVDYIQFLDSDLIPFFYPEKINSWKIIKQSNEYKLHLICHLDYFEELPAIFRINNSSIDSLDEKDIFTSIINKEIIMKNPIAISKSNYFVMNSFSIEGTFKSRDIPSVLHPFINDDDEEVFKYAIYLQVSAERALSEETQLRSLTDIFILFWYEKIKPLSSFYWHSKLKKARNLELLGDNKKSILILEEMSNEKKDRYDSLKLLGDIYRNYDKYDEAIKIYNEADDSKTAIQLVFHAKFSNADNHGQSFIIPGEGIYCNTGMYVDLTNCDFCTIIGTFT